jgi:hypothetical protein
LRGSSSTASICSSILDEFVPVHLVIDADRGRQAA